MKLLIVEDDAHTARLLRKGLMEAGYVVDVCGNGIDGIELSMTGLYDAVVLDVMLPGKDGWEVVSEIRRRGLQTPVMMLTARDAVEHRVRGLSLGADDYLVKPFAFTELVARIKSLVRRTRPIAGEGHQFADLRLDASRQQAFRGDIAIDLSAKEFLLLSLLLRHQGEVLSRTFISDKVWEMSFDSDSNVVEVAIRRLRVKMDDPFERKLIHTVRGRGYVLR